MFWNWVKGEAAEIRLRSWLWMILAVISMGTAAHMFRYEMGTTR